MWSGFRQHNSANGSFALKGFKFLFPNHSSKRRYGLKLHLDHISFTLHRVMYPETVQKCMTTISCTVVLCYGRWTTYDGVNIRKNGVNLLRTLFFPSGFCRTNGPVLHSLAFLDVGVSDNAPPRISNARLTAALITTKTLVFFKITWWLVIT